MKAQEIWAAGDYPAVARLITSVGEVVGRLSAVGPGDDVLDVACGDGNATLPAARAGASVTGIDITPELLDVGRAAAPDVTWVEGDAEALPFGDASFDVVLSTFGCMFAPDHRRAASEIVRVLRPGGRVAIAAAEDPDALDADLRALYAEHGHEDADGWYYEGEYLILQATAGAAART